MAQTNFTPILTYKSDTATSVPSASNLTNSTNGAELAVNTADKRLFTKDSGGNVVEVGTNPSSMTLPNGSANGVLYLNGSKVLTSGSALTFDGQTLQNSRTDPIFILNDSATSNTALRMVSSAGTTYIQSGISGGSFAPLAFTANGGSSEQMRLTSTGLGIGTSSPKKKLTVSEFSSSSTTPGTNPVIWVGGGNVTANTLSEIGFIYGSTSWSESNVPATVGFQLTSTAGFGKGALTFCTRDVTTDTAPTERMRIDSSGNLGLGVTPSAWSLLRGLQNGYANLAGYSSNAYLTANAYYNGSGWVYQSTANATAFMQQSGQHQWYTAASGGAGTAVTFTQAMTLDASGNLGVGTTSPATKIDARLSGTSSGAVITVGNTGSGGFGGIAVTDGGSYPVEMWASALVFKTGNSIYASATERARIDSSGNFLVNTTSTLSSAHQTIACTAGSGSKIPLALQVGVTTDGYTCIDFQNQNGSKGSIAVNVSTVSYNTSSDYRLKNTIAPMTGALEKVALLKPCTYKWNADGSDGEGFIAHELAEVCPQAVSGEKDAMDENGNPKYQGIDTSFLVATLTAAIQEQQAIITTLTARVAQLEAKGA